MKSQNIKVVFFNPGTCKKRATRFIFKWDYLNHCWEVTTITLYGESIRAYCGKPEDLITHYKECCIKRGEYATIKCA